MTVSEIHKMNNFEFMQWQIYFGRKSQREELDAMKSRRK